MLIKYCFSYYVITHVSDPVHILFQIWCSVGKVCLSSKISLFDCNIMKSIIELSYLQLSKYTEDFYNHPILIDYRASILFT